MGTAAVARGQAPETEPERWEDHLGLTVKGVTLYCLCVYSSLCFFVGLSVMRWVGWCVDLVCSKLC